jgi:hypothetical protein
LSSSYLVLMISRRKYQANPEETNNSVQLFIFPQLAPVNLLWGCFKMRYLKYW